MAIDIEPTTILGPSEGIGEHPAVNLTHNTKGSAWNRIGNNKLIGVDQFRHNYNPLTGIFEGRTIMGQWTNEILDPLDPSTANWAVSGQGGISFTTGKPSVIENRDAVQVDDDGGSTTNRYRQGYGTFTGNGESAEVILENGNVAETRVYIFDVTGSSTTIAVRLDWSDESVSVVSGSGDTSVDIIRNSGPNSGKVAKIGLEFSGTAGNSRQIYIAPTSFNSSTAGTIYHHYAGGFEESSPPPTPVYGEVAGQSHTQDPDIATVTDLDAIDFNPNEGSIIGEAILLELGQTPAQYLFHIDDGTYNNRIEVDQLSNEDFRFRIAVNGTSYTETTNTYNFGQKIKFAIAFDDNGFAGVINGQIVAENTSASMPSNLSDFSIGNDGPNQSGYLNGFYNSLFNYPRRLSNEDLIQETTI